MAALVHALLWTGACALHYADASGGAPVLLEASLTRRPYAASEPEAGLLVRVDGSVGAPVVRLLHGARELLRVTDAGPEVALHRFPLASLPPEADLTVELTEGRGGAPVASRVLRLARATPPGTGEGSFSQVDFTRRGLLVNGAPFAVVGLYVGDSNAKHAGPRAWNDTFVQGPGEEAKILAEVQAYRASGMTALMLYHLYDLPDAEQQRILDACAAAGVYMMYPLHVLFRRVVAGGAAAEAAWVQIEATVRRWRGHPGLLGWYACDDCTSTWIQAQRAAGTEPVDRLYARLKALDPRHVVIGAVESSELATFTGPSADTGGVALDVLMHENYVARPKHNASGEPGLRRGPMAFEAVVNCPGPYQLTQEHDPHFLNDPAKEAGIVYSLSWLSAAAARAPHQLYFRRKFLTPEVLGAVKRYAQEVRSSYADFTLAPEPLPRAGQVAVSDGFRAGLLPSGTAAGCALLVVTELQGQRREFAATFVSPDAPAAPDVALARVTDTLGPWETRQYRVGACPGVAAAAPRAPPPNGAPRALALVLLTGALAWAAATFCWTNGSWVSGRWAAVQKRFGGPEARPLFGEEQRRLRLKHFEAQAV